MSENNANNSQQKSWDPGQYNKFAAEREQPFWDLVGMICKVDNPDIVDLGCGDGRLTTALHQKLGAKSSLGIDFSDQMLSDLNNIVNSAIQFQKSDIATWTSDQRFDIIFANASLQWVSDHPNILKRLKAHLKPSGQLAIQIPSNADHPVYILASKLGEKWLGKDAPQDTVTKNVLKVEEYATILNQLGFANQNVRMQVYCHRLANTLDTLEWVKGTSLNRFKAIMPKEEYKTFLDEYQKLIISELGNESPYLFTFKRILIWAKLP